VVAATTTTKQNRQLNQMSPHYGTTLRDISIRFESSTLCNVVMQAVAPVIALAADSGAFGLPLTSMVYDATGIVHEGTTAVRGWQHGPKSEA